MATPSHNAGSDKFCCREREGEKERGRRREREGINLTVVCVSYLLFGLLIWEYLSMDIGP